MLLHNNFLFEKSCLVVTIYLARQHVQAELTPGVRLETIYLLLLYSLKESADCENE